MNDELTAAEVMQTEVLSVSPDLSILELEKLLVERQIGGVPVVDSGKLVGIVSRSDVIKHLTGDQAAEAIETEYHWDLGGPTMKREASSHGTRANPRAVAEMLADLKVADLMVSSVVKVSSKTRVSEVARRMVEQHIHRVVVVDGEVLAGVITTMDLARLFTEGRATAHA